MDQIKLMLAGIFLINAMTYIKIATKDSLPLLNKVIAIIGCILCLLALVE